MDQHPFLAHRPRGVSKEMLRLWFDWGKKNGYDYMIVVCDKTQWEDFPIFVYDRNYSEEYGNFYNKHMHTIQEVYDLGRDRELQMAAIRVWNGPRLVSFS
jgi:hypothetical protein